MLFNCWLTVLAISGAKASEPINNAIEDDIPDQELLEFIADIGQTDDETFDLLIQHGKDDLEKNDEPSQQKEPDHDS